MHLVIKLSTFRFSLNKKFVVAHLMFLVTSVIANFRLGRSLRNIRHVAMWTVSSPLQVKHTVTFGPLVTMPVTTVPRGGGARYLSMANNQTAHFIRVYIAVGSNLGNRFENIASSVKELCSDEKVNLIQTSFLYETAPMYVTDQPAFLNGMIEIETTLLPLDLLKRVKEVEEGMGRDFNGRRNGPRPVDLDIVFYGVEDDSPSLLLESETLKIPHPRIGEREFVLGPLLDLKADQVRHPSLHLTVGEMYDKLKATPGFKKEAVRILPLPRDRMLYFNETLIMGILNVTPDSFSDGGNYEGSTQIAAEQAFQMERDGAAIIDIGGESTRPGAEEVKIEEELQRTIPVIQRIRERSKIPISIDTRHSVVARAAVEAGADIVNDVSGGTFDSTMLPTVADLGVPMILMHMRGTPATMQSMTEYDNVVVDVVASLMERSRAAVAAGIPRWMQVLDPGIGFAKNLIGNLMLLKKLNVMRSDIDNMPILLGTSRKGFIGKITGEVNAADRDFGSVATSITALCLGCNGCLGCNILRVHNVKGTKQATMAMDAIVNA
jgi:dihydropteroate synthase/2-amino-4-hydroxy-6-hydroxymethyldihydropteridine diphosphokinase